MPHSPIVDAAIACAYNMANALKVENVVAPAKTSPFHQIDVGGEMYVRKDDMDQRRARQIGGIWAATPSIIRKMKSGLGGARLVCARFTIFSDSGETGYISGGATGRCARTRRVSCGLTFPRCALRRANPRLGTSLPNRRRARATHAVALHAGSCGKKW